MNIDESVAAEKLIGRNACPNVGIREEEALFWCEAILDRELAVLLFSYLECLECDVESTMVSKVLAEAETSVAVQVAWDNPEAVVELNHLLSRHVECLDIIFVPPLT